MIITSCFCCLRLRWRQKRNTQFVSRDTVLWGYRDSARLLGESCWQKKIKGHLGGKWARKSRNSCQVEWIVGVWDTRTVDSRPKFAQSWKQIQALKECLCCHICCAHLCRPLYRTVPGSRAVSNRESRYPLLASRMLGVLQCVAVVYSREIAAVCTKWCITAQTVNAARSILTVFPRPFLQYLYYYFFSVLQCVAVYCSMLRCAAFCCRVVQCGEVCCGVVQCGAMCCSVCLLTSLTKLIETGVEAKSSHRLARLTLESMLQCL